MTKRVSFRGVLRGDGGTALCTVSAMKVTAPDTGAVYYTDYAISHVSVELPDGKYELLANGESILVILCKGSWIV